MTTEDKTNLLIVDDLPENLLALDALIRGADRCIYKASSADVALDLLLEHDFAVAILDVQMPEVNGFELAALMRGTERTRHIPIIFVTAAHVGCRPSQTPPSHRLRAATRSQLLFAAIRG